MVYLLLVLLLIILICQTGMNKLEPFQCVSVKRYPYPSFFVGVNYGSYEIDGIRNPQLMLVRGELYHFLLDGDTTYHHPFFFSTDPYGGGHSNYKGEYLDGVVNSRATNGTVSIHVTNKTPDTLYYYSGIFPEMGNKIKIVSKQELKLLPTPFPMEKPKSNRPQLGGKFNLNIWSHPKRSIQSTIFGNFKYNK